MAGVDGINGQSLYFAAAQAAAHQQARDAAKKEKTAGPKKTSFQNALEKEQELFSLKQEGLPEELAGMEPEEAIVFLKDAVDIAGDQMAAMPSSEQIENFRKKLGNFMKYISRNNYEVLTIQRKYKGRPLINKKTGKPAYFVQVQVINQKFENLAMDLIHEHSQNINVLKRLEEIKGLIVDLLAS